MKVILSLSTIPSRLIADYDEGIKSNIDSLINQSYEDYEIHLNVPKILKTTGEKYIIPEWILNLAKDNPKFKIFDNLEDIGPLTKSFYTVQRCTDPEDILIIVDDDLVYHKDLVKEQVENQTKFPGKIVGYDGLRSREPFFNDQRDYYFTANYRTSCVDILQHYKSISYKRGYFKEDFEEFINQHPEQWNDDLLLSAYFSTKKIDRIATYHSSDKKWVDLDEWIEKGGVQSFPVLRHTSHEGQEGCFHFRKDEITNEIGTSLLIDYIDPDRREWEQNKSKNIDE